MVSLGKKVALAAVATTLIAGFACGKKDDAKEEGTSENVTKPTGALQIVGATMASAGSGMSSSTALVTDDSLTSADCDDHAYPVNTSNRERYGLNHLYCMATKDTEAPDSILGALTITKQMACLVESNLVFDGQPHDVTISKASAVACFGEQSAGDIPDAGFTATYTAGLGDQNPVSTGVYDGGVTIALTNLGMELKFQVKDRDGVLAVSANTTPGGSPLLADAFVASIDKTNGIVRYEAKFQRIRTANGDGSNGWNRHMRIYIKGTMDSDLKFNKVEGVQGIFSDLSNYGGSTPTSPLTSGFIWMVNGTETAGYASNYYSLGTASAPQLAASWGSTTAGCNGKATSAATCTSTAPTMTDAGTAFTMIPGASNFVNAEDWFKTAGTLSFTTVDLTQ